MKAEVGNGMLIIQGIGMVVFPVLVWILLSNVLNFVKFTGFNIWIFLLCTLGFILALIYVLYAQLAPRGIFTVVMDPATAMFVGLNGQPIKEIRCGHGVEARGWKEQFFAIFGGGWKWVGVYPFYQILPVVFEEWFSVDQTGKRLISHPEKVVNFVSTKRYSYGVQVKDAETAGSRVPVTITIVLVSHICDPMRFVFGVKNPITTVTGIVEARVRTDISRRTFDQLFLTDETDENNVNVKDLGDKIFEDLKAGGDYSDWNAFRKEYGIEIDAIGVKTISFQDEEANAERFKAERYEEALEIRARADANAMETEARGRASAIMTVAGAQAAAMAKETYGSVFETFLIASGLSSEDAKSIQQNPEVFERIYGKMWAKCSKKNDLKIKVDGRAYFEFNNGEKRSGTENGVANTVVEGILAATVATDIFREKNKGDQKESKNSLDWLVAPKKQEASQKQEASSRNEREENGGRKFNVVLDADGLPTTKKSSTKKVKKEILELLEGQGKDSDDVYEE